MRRITIIEEGNVGERIPISHDTFTCMSSVWIFDGDWNVFTETETSNLKQHATKLIGPVSGEVANELVKNLSETLRRMGIDVVTESTLDD